MHRGVQWPQTDIALARRQAGLLHLSHGLRGLPRERPLQEDPALKVNVASLSHANYGGAVGVWRLMDIFDRYQIKATIGANGLAVEKWPETITGIPQSRP